MMYKSGDQIEMALFGDVSKIYTGKIVGLFIKDHLMAYYGIETDLPVPGYGYPVVMAQESFLRLAGSTRSFRCDPAFIRKAHQ